MVDGRGSPGPIAERTFDSGFKIGVAGGFACVCLLYWFDVLSLSSAFHAAATLALFPVYVLAVGVALGAWLGYQTDASDLRRVTVEAESEES